MRSRAVATTLLAAVALVGVLASQAQAAPAPPAGSESLVPSLTAGSESLVPSLTEGVGGGFEGNVFNSPLVKDVTLMK
ncbi:hypothetical protein GCM10023080_069030 [Streptomyces pseudoechinosporeus]